MKPVYIVGAGCSVAGGAPVVSDFKMAAKEVAELSQYFHPPAFGKFQAALRWWDERAPEANIEEFYVLIELLERIESPEEVGIADAVRYLISKTLQIRMSDQNPRANPEITREFVGRLMRMNLPSPPTLITLNWDIALDNSCDDLDWPFHYGYPDAISLDTGRRLSVKNEAIPLLKLHGSFNWWACPRCGTLWWKGREKDILAEWEHPGMRKCRNFHCDGTDEGERLLPLMVPPTSQKFEQSSPFHPILSGIWRSAESALKDCTHLIIAGYSFPATDVQFRMFLLHALRTNTQLERITILTSPKYGHERPQFEESYLRVFAAAPRHRSKLAFTYERFEDWVRHGESGLI